MPIFIGAQVRSVDLDVMDRDFMDVDAGAEECRLEGYERLIAPSSWRQAEAFIVGQAGLSGCVPSRCSCFNQMIES
jgi:hypothetical protein